MKTKSFLLLLLIAQFSFSQTTFFDQSVIQKIEINFTQPDWDYQMDTAKYGAGGYLLASNVKVNGVQFDSVAVRYKGNSSYDSTYQKNPIHISIAEYRNQSYQGVTNIKLSNGYSDPSLIREVLSYDILKNYMDCPHSNYAQLYVNGNLIGLYSNDESIDNSFISDHLNSSNGITYKCNPIINPSVTTKCNLRSLSTTDSTLFFNYYDLKSTYGWNELVALCDTVTNLPANIGSAMDMDRWIWMLAFDNILVNLDSYEGAFCQNYYLYKDGTHRFNPIVWDLNMSFGGFPFLGSGAGSLAGLSLTQMKQLSPTIHSADVYWPVIKDIMANAQYKKMYIAHSRTITNEMFSSGYYYSKAGQLQNIIDTAVQSDPNNFYSYNLFQNGLTQDTVIGSYTVPGISNLMSARVTYLQSTADYLYSHPIITSITASDTAPMYNAPVTITADISNGNAAYLGYRFANTDKFERDTMFDDGLHNDGIAGDSVFGASFNMLSANVQYYIYAENANAGMFSPERAEHEFYTLFTHAPHPSAGQIVINEFMADNQIAVANEFAQYEDWIELYNTTTTDLSLFGLYLTDNFTNHTKYAFPGDAIIPADSFLIIWADQNPSTSSFTHCNFRLTNTGERLMIADAFGNVVDSISYGLQTPNFSNARCPNGTGAFVNNSVPTFGISNCNVGINELQNSGFKFQVFPNPATTELEIRNYELGTANSQGLFERAGVNDVKIYSVLGECVFQSEIRNPKSEIKIDVSSISEGVYFIELNKIYFLKIIKTN